MHEEFSEFSDRFEGDSERKDGGDCRKFWGQFTEDESGRSLGARREQTLDSEQKDMEDRETL